MAKTVNFTATGEQKIHCAGCEERIASALRRLPGIQDVQASHETQQVVVTFDPAQRSAEQVRATLEQMGCSVQAGPMEPALGLSVQLGTSS
jgi:copper chaperone